jgi:hypothetical protein
MHTHIFICHFLTLWFMIEGGAKLEHVYNNRAPYDGSHCIPSYGKGCLLKVVEAWGSSHWWIAFSHELYRLSKLTQPSSILRVMLSPHKLAAFCDHCFRTKPPLKYFLVFCVRGRAEKQIWDNIYTKQNMHKGKSWNKQKPKRTLSRMHHRTSYVAMCRVMLRHSTNKGLLHEASANGGPTFQERPTPRVLPSINLNHSYQHLWTSL